ncbi:hypothetical protein, partial [Candidatus Nitrotoga sp. HW29]|uniref:hypothetical protein n=1 Tax=Candidatus Nitrotoga sp. HW29 TaxID=2886963 RepID=UPI001EF19D89
SIPACNSPTLPSCYCYCEDREQALSAFPYFTLQRYGTSAYHRQVHPCHELLRHTYCPRKTMKRANLITKFNKNINLNNLSFFKRIISGFFI